MDPLNTLSNMQMAMCKYGIYSKFVALILCIRGMCSLG